MSASVDDRGDALLGALEGSTRPASLAVARGAELRHVALSEAREHASDLVPRFESLVRELGAHPRELALIVVGLGPGSYTGLRVAAATALGLALGSGAALIGVPSFEALAFGALAPGEAADVLVDARGGHLYHARYRRETDGVVELAAPSALTPDEARAALTTQLWLADDDALTAAGIDLAGARAEVRRGARPAASDLLALGRGRFARDGATPLEALTPLYLRSFSPKVRAR